MTQQDKKELIESINTHTTVSINKIEKRLQKSIENLAMATKKGFDEVHLKFDVMENRFDVLEKRFDTLEGRFDVLEGRFDILEGRFNVLDGRFDILQETVSENGERLECVESAVFRIEHMKIVRTTV